MTSALEYRRRHDVVDTNIAALDDDRSVFTGEYDKSHFDDSLSKIGVEGLSAILRKREKGVAGPSRKGATEVVALDVVKSYLAEDIASWEGHDLVLAEVARTLNKLADREDIGLEQVDARLPEQVADKIARLSAAAHYPESKQSRLGLSRLVLNMPLSEAEYFLSEEYIEELQRLTGNKPEIDEAIRAKFTTGELLRRANQDRRPDELIRQAVTKVTGITEDTYAYIREVSGYNDIPEALMHSLSEKVLLTAATLSPQSMDKLMASVTNKFIQLQQAYPLSVTANPWYVTEVLVKGGVNYDIAKLADKLTNAERLHHQVQQRGRLQDKALTREAIFLAPDMVPTDADDQQPDVAVETLFARRHYTISKKIGYEADGTLRRRMAEADQRGLLRREDFSALEHGTAHRYVLLDISERTQPENEKEVRRALELMRTIHTRARLFSESLPDYDPTESGYSSGVEQAISRRATEIIAILPKLLQGEKVTASLFHGEKVYKKINVDSIHDVLTALQVIDFALDAHVSGKNMHFSETTTPVSDGIERFVREDGIEAVSVRPSESSKGEQRVTWAYSITPEQQRLLTGQAMSEKNLRATLRLDLERTTGEMSLDLGGSLEHVEKGQPLDFLLASVATAGTQQYAQYEKGVNEPRDYHVRETFGKEFADEARYREWLNKVMYSLPINHATREK